VPDNYCRRFKVERLKDGDTLVVQAIDLGYHVQTTAGIEYRILRANAPETNRAASRKAGTKATEYTRSWLTEHAAHDPEGWLWASTTKTDSFGRYLAEITCSQGHNLSDDLLASGNAVTYKRKS
jgi:endonuclease YncB( thermonuclease family)